MGCPRVLPCWGCLGGMAGAAVGVGLEVLGGTVFWLSWQNGWSWVVYFWCCLVGQLDMEEAWAGGNLGYTHQIYPGRAVGLHAGCGGVLGHSSLEPPLGDGWCWCEPGTQGNGMAVAGQLECLHCAPTSAIKVEGVT